jgi:predicted dehydrogenase
MAKRLAIVGLGGWATSMHLPVCKRLQAQGRAQYVGLCDSDAAKAERVANDFGGKPYTEIDKMIAAEKPDGVILIVKPPMTPGLIEKAIQLQVPFLTEKPPTPSEAVHRALIKGVANLPHVIGYNRRFTPYAIKAKQWLDGHAVETIEGSFCRSRRMESDFTGTAVHGIDVTLHLAGSPIREARLESAPATGVRNLFLTAWTKENCRIALTISPNAARSDETYVLRSATRGAVVRHPSEGTDPGAATLLESGAAPRQLSPREFEIPDTDWQGLNGILAEHQNFIELLEGKQRAIATLQDTLNTQIICDAFKSLPADNRRHVKEITFEEK